MTVADKIKDLRGKMNPVMTQAGLSKATGLSLGAIRGYEQGERVPILSAAVKIARALGTDCTAFADCEDVAGGEKSKHKRKGK